MKILFRLFRPLASRRRAMMLGGALGLIAFSSEGALYTIQYGTGTAPYSYDSAPTDYQVDATGINNHQGVHGFVLHHNGADTYVDMPGENYYIDLLQVNSLGQVSGTFNANLGGYGCTSFFWSQGQLSLFSGISDPHVVDMNDLGMVVGTYGTPSREGFIWGNGFMNTFDISTYLRHFQYNGTTYDLTHGEATLLNAVNDRGQLLGHFGVMYEPISFWFIATPLSVPEPSTLSLLGLGLLGFARIRSQRKKP